LVRAIGVPAAPRRLSASAGVAGATGIAFAAIVVLGGLNAVAVRFSNEELAPFWGASLRFGAAAALLFGLLVVRGVPLPRGPALVGTIWYGVLGFGATFGFTYWGLVETPAGLAQTFLALVPLLTLLFAAMAGLERLTMNGVAGAAIALVGIAVVFGGALGGGSDGGPLSAVPLLAVIAGAVSMSISNVAVKRYPKCHAVAHNAIAMGIGAGILLAVSLVAGETFALPSTGRGWASVGYLVLVGSVVVFSLFLFVIDRWSASATSYSMLLMPLVTFAAAAALAGEAVTPVFLAGGALVLGGVYVGAFAGSTRGLLRRLGVAVAEIRRRGAAPAMRTAIAAAGGGPVPLVVTREMTREPPRKLAHPGCA
jgi:drug/metabolite transporter (DMT)-like permease